MTSGTSDAIVVGSGVIGLTTALTLAESGLRVAVWARETAGSTTSAVAGGLWWPYRIEPVEAVGPWSLRTLRMLTRFAEDPATTGVRMTEGTMAGVALAELEPWAAEVPGLRAARPGEVPDGPSPVPGVRARVPLVDMAAYLGFLRGCLQVAGGSVEVREVTSLAEAGRAAPLVVNCTGLGARELVPDPGMRPVRGQLVIVRNPGVEEWFVSADHDAADIVYVLPQPYGLILGGTAHEDVWDPEPDPRTAEAIVARCARVHPELAGATVLEHRVGLRPARSRVRLEARTLPGGARCVHNYGHGGAGVTVSWGCAEEAAALLLAG